MGPRRVVITGLGALTPIGNTLPNASSNLASSKEIDMVELGL